MNKKWMLLVMFALMLFGVGAASAAPAAQYDPVPPYTDWNGDFLVRSAVPFVWIRRTPFSTGDVMHTIYSGARVKALHVDQSPRSGLVHNDGQWWGYIGSAAGQGWVEVNSLVRDINTTPVPAGGAQNWRVYNVVRVKASVPFVWLRSSASSDAPNSGQLPSRTTFTIMSSPQYDGTQWWWQVREERGNRVGYIEQNALEYVRARSTVTSQPIPAGLWMAGYVVRVKAAVPFVWLRNAPDSHSGIAETVLRLGELVIGSESQEDATKQLWYKVTAKNGAAGWVEAQSLEFVRLS